MPNRPQCGVPRAIDRPPTVVNGTALSRICKMRFTKKAARVARGRVMYVYYMMIMFTYIYINHEPPRETTGARV